MITWFLFDLGNTLIKLAYERVLASICRDAGITRDKLIDVLEEAGGYRDMERGLITFWEFYDFLCERTDYRGSIRDLHAIWADFFDGTIPGVEDLLDELRAKYRIGFLSNSNEVHAEVIPRQFAGLFQKDDRFIFSHRFRVAKPDPEIFHRALEVLGAAAPNVAFVDDLLENVLAARALGIRAFQFIDTATLRKELKAEGLL
jgi:putative hydrolase of the HAD superfamily